MQDSLRGGLKVGAGIFAVLLWVLSAEYLAATLATPIADALGLQSEAVLIVFYVAAFAVVLAAPFVYFTDWEFGETARNAGYILVIFVWFLVADAAADAVVAATGLPYGAVVATIFVVPFVVITLYRFRDLWEGQEGVDTS